MARLCAQICRDYIYVGIDLVDPMCGNVALYKNGAIVQSTLLHTYIHTDTPAGWTGVLYNVKPGSCLMMI